MFGLFSKKDPIEKFKGRILKDSTEVFDKTLKKCAGSTGFDPTATLLFMSSYNSLINLFESPIIYQKFKIEYGIPSSFTFENYKNLVRSTIKNKMDNYIELQMGDSRDERDERDYYDQ